MATCSAGADGMVDLEEWELREGVSDLVRRLMVLHMARRLMARMTKGVRANLQMLMDYFDDNGDEDE